MTTMLPPTVDDDLDTPINDPAEGTGAPRPRSRNVFKEYRPSVVTGGLPALPLLLISGFALTEQLDRSAFGVLIPEIRDYFGVSLATVLTVTTLAGMLPLLLAVPVGYLSDRTKRTRIVAGGATTWGFFSAATAFASSIPMLCLFRFGSGAGKTIDPAMQSLLADYYPPDRRTGVFAVQQFGAQAGMFIAPLLAGVLAQAYGWQAPFLVFAAPSLALAAVFALRLREPVRGAHERRAMGASEEVANEEEKPPGWVEGWRIAKSVRTLNRIWMGLPFLVGAVVVILPLMSTYYADVFGLSESARGAIQSFDTVFAVAGLLAGGAVGNRLLQRSPSRVITYAGLLAALQGLTFLIVAVSPWLALAVGASYLGTFATSTLGPACLALISLTCSPRVRSFAQAFGTLFIAAGVLIAPFAGAISDHFGVRAGIAFMVPLFMLGALIISSAGSSVAADIRAATAAAMASHIARKAKEEGRTKLLVCHDLDVHYGQVQILFGVDFEVEEGEIVALLGTNGAGKSTLLNAIGGVTPPSNGAIFFDGEETTYLPANEHVGRGVVTVPGGKGIFPSLTVAENLQMATWTIDDPPRTRAALEQVFEFFPRLRERINEPAGNLSGGEQQMLTLGQAFLTKPRLLMIDELSLGLAPAVVEQLLEIVTAIHDQGATIVLVEQSVNVALTVADRAVFMDKGEVRFSGPTAELLDTPELLRSVFLAGAGSGGKKKRRQVAQVSRDTGPSHGDDLVLRASGLVCRFGGVTALDGASLDVREGEVLGIIGPNGAGKTTLFDVISGFVTPDAGVVELIGEDITALSPDQRALAGLGRSFQDARLFPALTVEENLLVALDRHLSGRRGPLTSVALPSARQGEARLRKRAERIVNLLNIAGIRDKFVRELSTGSRRIVDLGCVLAADPRLLLLDEPSSGIAQRETEEMPGLLNRIRAETGCSILLIEHDMQLIASVSDELVAMELGRVVVRGAPDDVLGDPRVVAAYLGNSDAAIHRSGPV